MQVSWLARLRSGAFSGFPNGLAFALRLQWRDRAGLEPASLFAELLRNIESVQLRKKYIISAEKKQGNRIGKQASSEVGIYPLAAST